MLRCLFALESYHQVLPIRRYARPRYMFVGTQEEFMRYFTQEPGKSALRQEVEDTKQADLSCFKIIIKILPIGENGDMGFISPTDVAELKVSLEDGTIVGS